MKNRREWSATTKVTAAEHLQLVGHANSADMNMSEWIRGKLFESADKNHAEVILAEVFALRSITLNLFYVIANKDDLSQEKILELIQHAESNKLAKARQALSDTKQKDNQE